MPTPPPPASGAEISTYTLTDVSVPDNGDVKVAVDGFANKDNANDVTITNTSTDPITVLTIGKFGGNDNQEDVMRVDLSEFSDNFTLVRLFFGRAIPGALSLIRRVVRRRLPFSHYLAATTASTSGARGRSAPPRDRTPPGAAASSLGLQLSCGR